MNNVILMGNLCADPELRATQSGKSAVKFRLAVRRSYRNAQSEYDSDFLSCVAFGNTADFIGKYFTKGRRMLAQGSIQTRSWDKEDGTKGYSTEIVVASAEFVDKPQDTAGNPPPAAKPKPQQMEMTPVDDDDQLPF